MLVLFDTYTGQINIFLFALIEVIGFVWIYGLNNLLRDIKFMLGIDLGIYWKFCWSFVIPLTLTFLFSLRMSTFEQVTYAEKEYPLGAICKFLFLNDFLVMNGNGQFENSFSVGILFDCLASSPISNLGCL